MSQGIRLAAVLAAVLLMGGCARTVTVLPTGGKQINIEVKFRGGIDAVSNKYYVLFGTTAPAIPLTEGYFFAPGEDFDPNKNLATNLLTYYAAYYSTWSNFAEMKNGTYYIVKGPFSNASGSTDVHNAFSGSFSPIGPFDAASPDRIKISIDISRMSSVPAELYFNMICVDASGNIKDYLRATDSRISIAANTIIPEKTEPSDPAVPEGLDMISWNMNIQ